MEISAAVLGTLVVQLFKLYESGSDAWRAPGFGDKELAFLKELAEALSKLRQSAAPIANAHDQQVALITTAFVRSYREHWVDDRRLLGRMRPLQEAAVKRSLTTIAAARDSDRGQAVSTIGQLLGSPLSATYYKVLWSEFTSGDDALIPAQTGTAKSEFEAAFCANYASLMATPAGKLLSDSLTALEAKRSELIRMLIAQDTLSWMNRHVLGNVRRHAVLGPMPLGAMYVEPSVNEVGCDAVTPIQTWFDTQLLDTGLALLVVSADFGHGKSLSARRLACRLALRYLQATEPSPECWYPVYVRACEDLTATENTLHAIIARALRRQANDPAGLCLGLSIHDEALTLPSGRALIIVDGFDEIALSPAEIDRFFDMLNDESSATRRFIVLGRPESLSDAVRRAQRWRVHRAEIRPFDDELAQRWLGSWNRSQHDRRPVEWQALQQASLTSLAQTPVLLFMAAFALSDPSSRLEHAGSGGATALYETFCGAMARGKLEQSGERHQVIEQSAGRLADALEVQGWKFAEPSATPQERLCAAMLWLMSRVAWETYVRDDQPLKRRHIEDVLERVLGVCDADVDAIMVGSLLALQSNLASGQALMFFGHRSFQEYLAARFWHMAIDHVSAMASRALQRDFEERNLVGAALLNIEQAYSFLIELEERMQQPERRARVLAWADCCFCDLDDAQPILKQHRPRLRAAALGIACTQPGFDLTRTDRRTAFISLLPFSWINLMTQRRWLIFRAPNARLDGLDLRAVNLHTVSMRGASFVKAGLKYVNFGSATLAHANFSDADLRGARFERADLCDANLSGANLSGAFLEGATLEDARLQGAVLSLADLRGASIVGGNLAAADLQGADLRHALLRRVNFESANLMRAQLEGARLQGAKLVLAQMQGANLQGANLEGANLSDANLAGANLSGANLKGAVFEGTNFAGANLDRTILSGANYENRACASTTSNTNQTLAAAPEAVSSGE